MGTSEKKPLILIVDDTPKNIQVLCSILEQENYRISVATDGEQALSKFDILLPDLVLLDIMMPKLNGIEVCRELKQLPKTKEIPIIFLTAKIESSDIVEGFEAGAADYITKPFQARELLSRVKTHLEIKKSRDLLHESNKKLSALNNELEEKKKKLEDMSQGLSEIVRLASQDLKGPLHSISFSAQLLQEKFEPLKDTESLNLIRLIENASLFGEQLISDIETLSQIWQSATIVLDINLNTMIQDISENITNDDVQFTFDTNFPTVPSNPILLRQVFEGLISNGIKFNQSPLKKIHVFSSFTDDQFTEIGIKDNGISISDMDKKRIFEPFTKLNPENEYPGSGIGLTIVLRAVRRLSGFVRVDSENSKGSTFFIKIPLNRED